MRRMYRSRCTDRADASVAPGEAFVPQHHAVGLDHRVRAHATASTIVANDATRIVRRSRPCARTCDTVLGRLVAVKHLRTDVAPDLGTRRSAIVKEARRASQVADRRIAAIQGRPVLQLDITTKPRIAPPGPRSCRRRRWRRRRRTCATIPPVGSSRRGFTDPHAADWPCAAYSRHRGVRYNDIRLPPRTARSP